jgi:hypothetical protein
MCKKLVLAAVAILVGTAVVRHTSIGSLAQVWWHDAKTFAERQVPPEVQIKQLEVEVNKIDRDIKQNLSHLAAQEVDTQRLEENVAALRDSQSKMRADIVAMTEGLKGIKGTTDQVAFNGRNYRASELTRKLDHDVAKFEAKKAELRTKEKLLDLKKQALEAANDRITAMADQKEKLRVVIAKFETRQELNRLSAVRNEAGIELDDSQVARCNDLANQIERRLAIAEKESELTIRYGFAAKKVDETKPAKDVVKAAEKALEEEKSDRVASQQ